MGYDAPIVFYDACVLYPFHLRNLLVQLAVDGLVEARWSDVIHDEWIGNLLADEPRLTAERLQRTRARMEAVLPAARVANFERHMTTFVLPNDGDRHVLGAAIEAGATTIVTWNLRDFPSSVLEPHGVVARSPDDLLCALVEKRPQDVVACVERSRLNLSRSRPQSSEFLAVLARQGLSHLSALLAPLIGDV